MKKYRTEYNDSIESLEVVKETKSRITFIKNSFLGNKPYESTENKISDYHSWHNTFEEAKNYLIEKCNDKIKRYKMMTDAEMYRIEKIKLLQDK